MNFKVGDRVKILGGGHEEWKGYSGSIFMIDECKNWHGPYAVEMGDDKNTLLYCNDYEIEYNMVKSTKIARKMYAGKIEKEENGWLYLK